MEQELDEEEDVRRIHRGKSPEERIEFWRGILNMLESQPGLAWQGLMQREVEKLQQQMLVEPSEAKRNELLHRWRQQAWVTTFPATCRARLRDLEGKLKES